MFHLINSIYSDLTQKPRFNILCVGSGESGKTTLLQTIKGHYVEGKSLPSISNTSDELPKTRPTVGQNVFDIQSPLPSPRPLILPAYPLPQVDPAAAPPSSSWLSSPTRRKSYGPSTSRRPSKAALHVWDLGGEKGLRSIWKEYFNEADCVVYFWDCGNASRGEAREEEWEVLVSLAQEPQLAHLPFLVLLSRSDLTTRSMEKGKAKATGAAGDDAVDAAAATKSSMEDDEDGDLSLSVSESTDSIRDASAHASQRQSLALSSRPASPPPSPPAPPETPSRPSVTPTEDSDVLESLRMFIVSHIEAFDQRGAGEDDEGDGGGDGDEEPAADDVDSGTDTAPPPPSTPFPETTILPISSLTGKGIVECMDWFVHKSLNSTRRV